MEKIPKPLKLLVLIVAGFTIANGLLYLSLMAGKTVAEQRAAQQSAQ